MPKVFVSFHYDRDREYRKALVKLGERNSMSGILTLSRETITGER